MSYYKTNKGILFEDYDCDTENPRENCDTYTTFLIFSSRKISPDKNEFRSYNDFVINFGGNECDKVYREQGILNGNKYLIEKMNKKGYLALPVYVYEHTGICYEAAMENPFNCPFDSGLAGIIFASYEDIRKNYSVKNITAKVKEKVFEYMKSEVSYYSDWANGNVYYYQLLDNDTHEEIDSCGGFIGDIEKNGALECFDINEYKYIGENL